ncbi:ATP-binding protein [Parabacteroides sp. BX2]|uniref:ATP-binding protein n=2 Tax=Parabacteroides TaxID=375288 RepID=A0ABR7E1A6_9BACT|nr:MULTISPECIES: ATP-binding protein [Parabacteroides]MBC5643176.1 ATP-binding protein [Parabacteroides segnis]MCM0713020.1 ATP-binding protein [Parabacteroides sp. TA-V-105]
METMPIRKLPVGIQDFTSLREDGFLYVDKTALVYQMATTGKPYFMSRPRRFGKSLLLSTLEAYFLGRKDLFKGLAIEQLEKEWKVYPVLHLSLNAKFYETKESLEQVLDDHLVAWEDKYEITKKKESTNYEGRFMQIIRQACEKTGEKVVVLIDEYDKPLLRTLFNDDLHNVYREMLTGFYTVLKDADRYLRFVFITGVTKFSQLGIFSNLNQLIDISMAPDYATVCGMTKSEIERDFQPELATLAAMNKLTYEQTVNELTKRYDGYHFSEFRTEGIFNPFSVLNALLQKRFSSYWFATGTPTMLVDMLKKTDYDLRQLDGIEVPAAALTDYRADFHNPVPIIYQSGYLTIKDYDPEFNFFRLGYPNAEVEYGWLNFITPYYTSLSEANAPFYIGKFSQELRAGDVDAFMERLRAFFADIPYELNDRTERHYQIIFYLVFKLLGQYVDAEVRSARGRADAVVKTTDYIYVFEFKLSGSVDEALRQIDDRGYLIPYTVDGRQLVKVGADFNKEDRNIGDWKAVFC